MNNMLKCNRCKKILISEEYDSHLCTPFTKGYKRLEIDYYIITKDQQGRTVIVVKDIDGILYNLVKRERRHSDKISLSSDESLHSENDDENRRGLHRTGLKVLLRKWQIN